MELITEYTPDSQSITSWDISQYLNTKYNKCIIKRYSSQQEWIADCDSKKFSIYTYRYNSHPGIFHLDLPKGKYRIVYVSGACNNGNGDYGNWNREWSDKNGLAEGHDCSHGQRWMVFQCTYGVLPGFTLEGYSTAEVAEEDNIGKYLDFEIIDDLGLDIWYDDWYSSDNVGTIRYQIINLDKSSEVENVIEFNKNNAVNAIDVEFGYTYQLYLATKRYMFGVKIK